jgi:hypothetical protein
VPWLGHGCIFKEARVGATNQAGSGREVTARQDIIVLNAEHADDARAIDFGHHQGVTSPTGRECLAKPGTFAVSAS